MQGTRLKDEPRGQAPIGHRRQSARLADEARGRVSAQDRRQGRRFADENKRQAPTGDKRQIARIVDDLSGHVSSADSMQSTRLPDDVSAGDDLSLHRSRTEDPSVFGHKMQTTRFPDDVSSGDDSPFQRSRTEDPTVSGRKVQKNRFPDDVSFVEGLSLQRRRKENVKGHVSSRNPTASGQKTLRTRLPDNVSSGDGLPLQRSRAEDPTVSGRKVQNARLSDDVSFGDGLPLQRSRTESVKGHVATGDHHRVIESETQMYTGDRSPMQNLRSLADNPPGEVPTGGRSLTQSLQLLDGNGGPQSTADGSVMQSPGRDKSSLATGRASPMQSHRQLPKQRTRTVQTSIPAEPVTEVSLPEEFLKRCGNIDRDQAVDEYLRLLEVRFADYLKQDLHEEAETTRSELLRLRTQEEKKRRVAFQTQQQNERKSCVATFSNKRQEFDDMWDRKMTMFEDHFASMQSKLASRQEADRKKYSARLQDEADPRTPRWSPELLNLRKIQNALFQQRKYAAAAQTKSEADDVQMKEHETWKAKRGARIASLEQIFRAKQQIEMDGLLTRIQAGRKEQMRTRARQLELLLRRQENTKISLASQQAIIRHRVEKFPMLPSSGLAGYTRGGTSGGQ